MQSIFWSVLGGVASSFMKGCEHIIIWNSKELAGNGVRIDFFVDDIPLVLNHEHRS